MEARLIEILEAHNLSTMFSYRRACEAGIKEVVEWIDGKRANPQGSSANPDYTVYLSGFEWQAKLKEWGIE